MEEYCDEKMAMYAWDINSYIDIEDANVTDEENPESFFAAALVTFYLRKDDPLPFAKVLLASGLGFFGFSMFRLVLFQVYRDNLTWFVFWEEVTELIYIVGVGAVLWIFRGRL